MGLVFKNNAKTTLSSGVNDSTTTIPVTEGSVFPVADSSAGTFFFATLDDDTNNEIVKVTTSSGNAGNQNLTVVRAQESTSARAFSSGDKVELRLTAGMVDTFNLSGNAITLSSNKMGFGDSSPEVSLDLGAQTDALHAPVGTTAQRPGSPEAGYLRYNSTTGKFEGYTNAWGDLADGSDFLVTNTYTTANASTTAFAISNAVQDEKQLLVFIDGVFQAHNSYSVSGTTVTLSTAPASGREVTIYSALSNLQGANMVIATMTGDNSDTTLDLGVTPVSENNVQVYIDGTYQNKSTYSISGQTLTFSTAPPTGVAVEAITHTVLDISAAASSVLIDEFTGDGSDTTFTLSAAPTNENNTQVFVGGVYQEKATYSISNAVLTFSTAPANGVSIEVVSIAVGQINSAVQLADADGDTQIQVEESSDEDKIRFDTGGTERMMLDDSGRLLIGQDSGDSFNSDSMLRLQRTGDRVFMQFKTDADQNSGILFGDVDDDVECAIEYEPANKALTLSTGNNAEAMRIDSSGNVGIGTSSPNAYTNYTVLTIDSPSSGTGSVIDLEYRTDRSLSMFSEGSLSTIREIRNYPLTLGTNNTERMRIDASGRFGFSGTYPPTSAQFMRIEEVFDTNRIMRLANRDNSGNSNTLEIGHSDNNEGAHVIIAYHGNNTSGASGDPYNDAIMSLQVNGNMSIDGTLSQGSDRRLKKDIANSAYGLAAINQLIPRTYKHRDVSKEMIGTQIGFIADEVESVIPEVVSKFGLKADGSTLPKNITGYGDEAGTEETFDNVKTLDYERLVVVLTKALQEADDKIEALAARIETLEGGE